MNQKIRAREVRLIDFDGRQVGVVETKKALELAEERELDLVEVAPDAKPPVCKVMDFGKYKYQMGKKQTAKKGQDVKVIKLRPRIDVGDLERKVRKMREFLNEGDKVKIAMTFRGREKGRPDLGMKVFDRLKVMLEGGFNITQEPRQEGSIITMSISPK